MEDDCALSEQLKCAEHSEEREKEANVVGNSEDSTCFESSFAKSMVFHYSFISSKKTATAFDDQVLDKVKSDYNCKGSGTQSPLSSDHRSSSPSAYPFTEKNGTAEDRSQIVNSIPANISETDVTPRKGAAVFHQYSRSSPRSSDEEEELAKLRLEYDNMRLINERLREENQRLRSLCSQSPHVTMLQWQTETLQLQLMQMKSQVQMRRDVMDQVSKFLERAYKELNTLSASLLATPSTKTKARFPRSRSIHIIASNSNSNRTNVNTSTSYSVSSTSLSSPECCKNVRKCKEMEDRLIHQNAYINSLKDYFRRPSNLQQEEISLEKLSQEAFRLLRTVQNLQHLPELDLINLSSVTEGAVDSSEKADNTSVGSCTSLLRSSCSTNADNKTCSEFFETNTLNDNSSSESARSPSAKELDVTTKSMNENENKKCKKAGPVTTITNSVEDESGFSSMSSFQDTNAIAQEVKSHSEIGVPVARYDQRWRPSGERKSDFRSSINFCNGTEILHEFWV